MSRLRKELRMSTNDAVSSLLRKCLGRKSYVANPAPEEVAECHLRTPSYSVLYTEEEEIIVIDD
jgi:hypothetical protein